MDLSLMDNSDYNEAMDVLKSSLEENLKADDKSPEPAAVEDKVEPVESTDEVDEQPETQLPEHTEQADIPEWLAEAKKRFGDADEKALLEKAWQSYRHLEPEFTRKSQELSEAKKLAAQLRAELELSKLQTPGAMSDDEYAAWESLSEKSGFTIEQLQFMNQQRLIEQEQQSRSVAYQTIHHQLSSNEDFNKHKAEITQMLQDDSDLIESMDSTIPPAFLPQVFGKLVDGYLARVKLKQIETEQPKLREAIRKQVQKEMLEREGAKRTAVSEAAQGNAATSSGKPAPKSLADELMATPMGFWDRLRNS